jgi:DNA-binding CsgD family transcriptional regulator
MPETPPRLLEREGQLAALRGAVSAAAAGEGGVVVVRGPAGAGKSSLLAALAVDDVAAGGQIRRARCGELEREFAFGVVHQLLDPLLRSASPEEADRLLSGAAASAAPLFGRGEEPVGAGAADASFAVLHGLYWLLATVAEESPLILVIDDLQWADEPSLRLCDFLARRIAELPVLLVAGVRVGESPEVEDLIDGWDAETLESPPLSVEATRVVVEAAVGEPIDADVAAAAHEATGGNPLLLSELARSLAHWDGAPTADVVRAAVPSSVARSVGRRLRRLTPEDLRAAQVLAVLGDGVALPVVAEVGGLDPVALAAATDRLEEAGFLGGRPPRFVHALIRQAVVDGVPGGERAELHTRAAASLRRGNADRELVVAHLLAAPPLGEPWTVELLREAGREAMRDGAAELAVRRFRRALEESGSEPDGEVLFELGTAELAAGDPRALATLRRAADSPRREIATAALAMLVSIAGGNEEVMGPALGLSLDLVEGEDSGTDDAGGAMLLQSMLNVLALEPAMTEARGRLLDLAGRQDDPGTLPLRALEAAGAGAERDAVVALAAPYLAGEASLGIPGLEGGHAWGAVVAANAVEEPTLVDPLLARLEVIAGRGASRIVAYFEGQFRGSRAAAVGQLPLAEAMLRGAIDNCMELTDHLLERTSIAELAGVLVRMGRLDEAEELIRPVADEELEGIRYVGCTWWTRRAELRAAQARWSEAVGDLRRVEAALAGWGWDTFPLGRGEALMALALIESGEPDEGVRRAEGAAAAARRRGIAGLEAAALLAQARGAGDPERALELAVATAEAARRSPDLVLRAEADLAHGAALRRAGQRKAARTVLGAAREAASRAGAAELLSRATEEYVVAGGRPQRIAVSGVDSLTPSERRTAELAAAGHTNREIAERLFVTRKTVEYTLGHVFQKLDISSRTRLPEFLGDGSAADQG